MKLYAAKLIDDSSDKPKKSRKQKPSSETKKEEEEEEKEEEVKTPEKAKTPEPAVKETKPDNSAFDWEKHWNHCEEKFYKEAFQRFEIMQANQEKHAMYLEEIKALAKKPPSAPKKKKKTIVYASSAEEEDEEEEEEEETIIVKKKKKARIASPKKEKPRIEYDDYLFDSIFSDRRKV